MEPVEVHAFHGRRSDTPPDVDEIRVTTAPESRFDELIDLALARLPHLPRPEVAWPFEVRDAFAGLFVEEAVDRRDQLLGWGMTGRPTFAPPERQFLRVVVAASEERRGVGRALHGSLVRHLLPTTAVVSAAVSDDDPRSLAVAQHWGFTVEEHSIDSALDLTALPVAHAPGGVILEDAPGLTFDDEEEVDRMLLASQTNPEAAVGIVFSLGTFRTMTSASEVPICVVARVDGRPAGITFGAVADGELGIVYSGIDPQFRGRGLMKLVKQQAHLSARRAGARISRTNNEEHNEGIRRVNTELGYVVHGGAYRLAHHVSRP